MKVEIDREQFLRDLETIYSDGIGYYLAYERLRGLVGPSFKDVSSALKSRGLNGNLGWSEGAWYSRGHSRLKFAINGGQSLSNLRYLRDKINEVLEEFGEQWP